MSSFKIVGKYIGARPEKKINDTLTVQDFAIETDEQYYNTKVFQIKNERRDVLSGFQKNDLVEVSFNIKCIRTESGAWFTTLEAWRVQRHIPQTTEDFAASEAKNRAIPAVQTSVAADDIQRQNDDDLPF